MKKAAIINDLSSFGKCSLTASIPVLSVMGIQVCPLPTAVLTAQTGYDHHHMYSFTDKFEDYMEDWKQLGASFDGIYSGFLPDCRLQENICRFYERFAAQDTVFLVDPVMGDNGKVFGIYSDQLREGMIHMLQYADLTTPNLTEACLLAGVPYESLAECRDKRDYLKKVEEIGEKICRLGSGNLTAFISGIKFTEKNEMTMGNYVIGQQRTYMETKYLGGNYSGTGDLFASCLLGYRMLGADDVDALKNTMDFLRHSIEDTEKEKSAGNDGVLFERYLYELIDMQKKNR